MVHFSFFDRSASLSYFRNLAWRPSLGFCLFAAPLFFGTHPLGSLFGVMGCCIRLFNHGATFNSLLRMLNNVIMIEWIEN